MKESNLSPAASQLDGNGFTGRREEHHPSIDRDGTSGSRTHRSPRFELGRFAGLRTVPSLPHPAPPTGFEPTISTLTGWRALQAAPRGRCVDGSGGIRTLSISRSEREWSAGCLPSRWRDTQGGIRTHIHPGLSQPASLPLAYLGCKRRKPWDSNPQAAAPLPVFKTGP